MKQIRILLAFLFTIVCFGGTASLSSANSNIPSNDLENIIPKEAMDYANKHYKTFCKILINDGEDIDLENVQLQNPYYVYNPKSDKQQLSSFIFPIYQRNDCICLFEVDRAENGWVGSITCKGENIIDQMEYASKNCLFYSIKDSIFIENETEKMLFSDNLEINKQKMTSDEKDFLELGYMDKKQLIYSDKISFHAIKHDMDIDQASLTGYTPTLTSNTANKVTCKVSGYLSSQGNKPICWAACVATTYNYYNGKNVTATGVCNKVGHGYSGATTSEVLKAFQTYGFKYKNVYTNYPDISNINACLRNYYLLTIQLGTLNDDNIHLIDHNELITGTQYVDNIRSVRVYNPQGSGSTKWVTFNGNRTIFEATWGWKSTYLPVGYLPNL